jgi:hypothetical protein
LINLDKQHKILPFLTFPVYTNAKSSKSSINQIGGKLRKISNYLGGFNSGMVLCRVSTVFHSILILAVNDIVKLQKSVENQHLSKHQCLINDHV